MSSSEAPPAPRRLLLPLTGRQQETPTITTFRFGLEGTDLAYRPGQHAAWGVAADGKRLRKPFTLSSSPTEETFVALTTRLTGSPMKLALADLGEGDEIELRGPFGDFFLDPKRAAIMIAGGIGITAFRSMIRFAADEDHTSPIALVYSSRAPEEIAFRHELDALAAERRSLRVLHTVSRQGSGDTPWDGPIGRIDGALLRRAGEGLDEPLYYLCGPPAMVRETRRLVRREIGVRAEDIRSEEFSGYQ